MFTATLFTIDNTRKQPKYSPEDEWVKEMWYNICKGILFSHKKVGNFAICNNMNLPGKP